VSLRADQPRMRGHAPTARGLVKSKGYKPSLTKPSAPTKEGGRHNPLGLWESGSAGGSMRTTDAAGSVNTVTEAVGS
jgi:hypothetical protein